MAIDLSQLSPPAVPGLVLSIDEVHRGSLDWLRQTYDWAVTDSPSDPAWRLTRLWALRETLVRQAIADAMAQTSLAYAAGSSLDHIGLTYAGLARLDGEGDKAYRERLAAAPERYAVGLSGAWYESVARGVEGVDDAYVASPAPGKVTIWVLADELAKTDGNQRRWPDGIPDADLLAGVRGRVTADEARQQTDQVTVQAAARQRYDVTVALTTLGGPDAAAVRQAALEWLRLLAARARRIGQGLTKALVAGAAVDIAAVKAAAITLQTVAADGTATAADAIAGADGVSLQARNLTVTAA